MERIELGIAKCNRCQCQFEWIPGRVNSTKESTVSDGVYPRCPKCGSYRQTVHLRMKGDKQDGN